MWREELDGGRLGSMDLVGTALYNMLYVFLVLRNEQGEAWVAKQLPRSTKYIYIYTHTYTDVQGAPPLPRSEGRRGGGSEVGTQQHCFTAKIDRYRKRMFCGLTHGTTRTTAILEGIQQFSEDTTEFSWRTSSKCRTHHPLNIEYVDPCLYGRTA